MAGHGWRLLRSALFVAGLRACTDHDGYAVHLLSIGHAFTATSAMPSHRRFCLLTCPSTYLYLVLIVSNFYCLDLRFATSSICLSRLLRTDAHSLILLQTVRPPSTSLSLSRSESTSYSRQRLTFEPNMLPRSLRFHSLLVLTYIHLQLNHQLSRT